MAWQDRITVDPQVCHGHACIKGSRVLVSVVLDSLAERQSHEAIAASYRISTQDVQAALEYAAELTKDRVVSLHGSSAA